ncbi:polysaccharide deacetylase family protein [Paenibacillus antarcticus]|nr:polysaccharide deacetylase family protein [Paenibacillus antarcticus]
MFACSESYSAQISTLREIQNLDALSLMPFITPQPVVEEAQMVNVELSGITSLKSNRKLMTRGSRLLISTVIIAMLSFLYIPEYSYISEKVFANVFTVSPNIPAPVTYASEENPENYESNLTAPLEEKILPEVILTSEVAEPKIPTKVTLVKAVSFNVPSGSVALTFDDGPSIYTKEIVNILNTYNVGGTFFFVGTQVRKFPEAVKYVDANGFSIGNHSMTHANLPQLSATDQQYELHQTNQFIQQIINKPVLLFRPPYGSRDDNLNALVANSNMRMVLWNNDPEDWNTRDSQKILHYIMNSKSTGSIILLHESKETLKALPLIIQFLQKQQLEISSLI